MNSKAVPMCFICLTVGFVVAGCGGGAPAVDWGDQSSGNLLWGANHYIFEEKDVDKALAYADKALELYGDEARSMQASLSGFPATDPPEATFKYQVLNNVAMVLMAKSEALLQKGGQRGAEEVLTMIIEDFGSAQTQEFGEWQGYADSLAHDDQGFIMIADAARKKLGEIQAGGS